MDLTERKVNTMKMDTIRDAINAGAKTVYCRNGLEIDLPDTRNSYPITPPKMINGKPVYRRIFCSIKGSGDLSAIKHRSLFNPDWDWNYFRENDYDVKEREMNMLIRDNGGIDVYKTDYWATGWMYY